MKKIILVILILIVLGLSVFFTIKIIEKKQNDNAPQNDTTQTTELLTTVQTTEDISTNTIATTEEITEATTEAKPVDKIDSSDPDFPQSFDLELELIQQHPELPAGCESVSLTMILNYYGYDLEKTYIIENYQVFSDNFVLGYWGDPYSSTIGGGCYAPGMTDTANNFLKDKGSNLRAKNITGTEFEDLFEYVAAGKPVLIWSTISMAYPDKGFYQYDNLGNAYAWDNMEHCVVLSGYDYAANTVSIYDPIDGFVYRDMDAFKYTYDSMHKMAIILKEY